MLFHFLQKQKDIKKQKKLVETIIVSLNISEEQKKLYIEALEVTSPQETQELYKNLSRFVEQIELKELEQIQKESFTSIS